MGKVVVLNEWGGGRRGFCGEMMRVGVCFVGWYGGGSGRSQVGGSIQRLCMPGAVRRKAVEGDWEDDVVWEEVMSEGSEEMSVYSRRKQGGFPGELLPFDVRVISPPPRDLGSFRLDPRIHRGDVLDYKGASYIVRRVRMHFAYRQGRFHMTKKTAEVKSLSRKMMDEFLDQLYRSS